MSKGKPASLPSPLLSARRRLEEWRNRHRPRARLPKEIWSAAVALARRHGLHKTAKALRLDYYGLKKRVEKASDGEKVRGVGERKFIEVFPGGGIEPSPGMYTGVGERIGGEDADPPQRIPVS